MNLEVLSQTQYIEFLGQVNVYIAFGIKIVVAALLGLLIGVDRESKKKAAGIKTNMLICLGACLYTAASYFLQKFLTPGAVADPSRVAAQIVSGIGFIGAGTILRGNGGYITGLTTAATIWVVAAVGMTVGFGFPVIATLFTVTILGVLRLLGPLYRLLDIQNSFHLKIYAHQLAKKKVKWLIRNEAEHIDQIYEELDPEKEGHLIINVLCSVNPTHTKQLDSDLFDVEGVLKVEWLKRRTALSPL